MNSQLPHENFEHFTEPNRAASGVVRPTLKGDSSHDPLSTPIGLYSEPLPKELIDGSGWPDSIDREIGRRVLGHLDNEA